MESVKKIVKTRLLDEMLGSVKEAGGADWSVLVMDYQTTRVMSSACRISEILDYGVSLVENVEKRKEPLPALSGVYFISPSDQSVASVIEDFKTRPLYKTAHLFFSTKCTPGQLDAIKACPGLLARLKQLKEVNLEFLLVDSRTFLTDEEYALHMLFGDASEGSAAYRVELQIMATRLASLFVSLKELPSIRFRAGKPSEDAALPGMDARSLVAQRLAVEVSERLQPLQRSRQLPEAETCDLLILDRGYDPVAPVIHEWTYEAMAYDLLNLERSTFKYDSETAGGKTVQKEHLLDERDELWVELRHRHFAGASLRLTQLLDDFRAKNRVASYKGGAGAEDGGGLDTRAMAKLVAGLPQYREQLTRLSVHVELASRLNRAVDERALVELGKLEQDLVFGDATSKDVINFLQAHLNVPTNDKVRLLMCYAATHPEKLDATKEAQWQKLARMGPDEMRAVLNLEMLGVPVRKRGASSGISFGRRRKRAVRKDREADENEEQWSLSRFVPLLQEAVEGLAAGRLSADEFPFVRPPANGSVGNAAAMAVAAPTTPSGAAKGGSVRTNKGAVAWAKRAAATAATKEDALLPAKGRRIVVFVVGGMTRSEMRAVHKLAAAMGRDIVLGSTSVDTPSTFVARMQKLTTAASCALEIDFK